MYHNCGLFQIRCEMCKKKSEVSREMSRPCSLAARNRIYHLSADSDLLLRPGPKRHGPLSGSPADVSLDIKKDPRMGVPQRQNIFIPGIPFFFLACLRVFFLDVDSSAETDEGCPSGEGPNIPLKRRNEKSNKGLSTTRLAAGDKTLPEKNAALKCR
ncbi:hypothetical protein CDAR_435671 [Caerostris darwini]|uniref:Uncharacterized protein n=1 Tax=Caerostris darwini TaxID=1538125 RepID=A0AAV4PAQ5_9ARAC|nr:hypothetical protein CDAR_435671 [Caerostris darwini]